MLGGNSPKGEALKYYIIWQGEVYMNYENEIWVAVKDYPNYEVSSMGRVRSLQRRAPHILR